jgi:hypothetical protein
VEEVCSLSLVTASVRRRLVPNTANTANTESASLFKRCQSPQTANHSEQDSSKPGKKVLSIWLSIQSLEGDVYEKMSTLLMCSISSDLQV